MRVAKGRVRRVGCLVMAALTAASGCVHPHGPGMPPGAVAHHGAPAIAVPPVGTVPTELGKVTLPPYVVEAPDTLVIQVVQKGKVPARDAENKPIPKVGGKPGDFEQVDGTLPLPIQDVSGTFLVRPDGSVGLGFWGSVTISGLSLDQAADAIRQHLLRSETLQRLGVRADALIVVVDVLAYNSKRYYVVTDGGGYGEQVYPFPIQGSETVLDAIANINGLPAVASKRNIWVARRCPHPNQPWQILPVDWVGITQHGLIETNYQILPGDRIYVKAQRLVTLDTAMARVLSPIERLFGITLLGSSTVNQVQGRGAGFGNNAGF